ncbi:MAG TPA: hypothetical protein VFL36_04710 [Myxococcales bacterium]|nr:hypothetical protein [Myxococcales bacterium]
MRVLLLVFGSLIVACSHAPQAQPADADADKCATAADCHGMLPHLCRACADGGTECSRWACVSGTCMVAPACQ